jgi:hypothetical protein
MYAKTSTIIFIHVAHQLVCAECYEYFLVVVIAAELVLLSLIAVVSHSSSSRF